MFTITKYDKFTGVPVDVERAETYEVAEQVCFRFQQSAWDEGCAVAIVEGLTLNGGVSSFVLDKQ